MAANRLPLNHVHRSAESTGILRGGAERTASPAVEPGGETCLMRPGRQEKQTIAAPGTPPVDGSSVGGSSVGSSSVGSSSVGGSAVIDAQSRQSAIRSGGSTCRFLRLLLLVGASLALSAPAEAQAQAQRAPEEAGPAGSPPARGPEERIRELERNLVQANQLIRQLARELQALKAETGVGGPVPGPTPGPTAAGRPRPGPATAPTAPGPRVAQAPQPPQQPADPFVDEEEEVPEPTDRPPEFTPAFLREARAVLIRRGLFEVDTRLGFSHTDRNFISARGLDVLETIFIGDLRIGEVTRDSIRPSISFRYGVADRLQLNASVPYRFQFSETNLPTQIVRLQGQGEDGELIIEEGSSTDTTSSGIGDVEFGLSYHLFRSRPFVPDTIFSVSVKSRTGDGPFDVDPGRGAEGTGFWGVRGGLTFVRVLDPASLFGSVSYFYHIPDDVTSGSTTVEFDPADTFSVGAGIAYALNPFLSLTTQVNAGFTSEIQFDGVSVEGSSQRTAELSLGVAYGFGRNRSIDAAVSFGLTSESPDYGLAISMPFTFAPPVPWSNWDFGPFRRFLSF